VTIAADRHRFAHPRVRRADHSLPKPAQGKRVGGLLQTISTLVKNTDDRREAEAFIASRW
jgi:hypothetical protein